MTEQQRRAAFHKATGRIATSDMEMYYVYIRGLVDGAAAMKERAAKVCVDIALKPSNVILGVATDCAAAIRALGDDDE